MHRYIENILRAKVYDVVMETLLDPAPGLSRRLDNTVLLKRPGARKEFREFLDASGFACREETHNPAYRLFAGGSETSG